MLGWEADGGTTVVAAVDEDKTAVLVAARRLPHGSCLFLSFNVAIAILGREGSRTLFCSPSFS